MRRWLILLCTLLVGMVLGAGAATRGPAFVAPYWPRAIGGPSERVEGVVVRKQRDGDRLLVKVATAQGPMLVTFTRKAVDLDVLLDPGDTVTLMLPGYATFVDDPALDHVKGPARNEPPVPSAAPAGSRQGSSG